MRISTMGKTLRGIKREVSGCVLGKHNSIQNYFESNTIVILKAVSQSQWNNIIAAQIQELTWTQFLSLSEGLIIFQLFLPLVSDHLM